MTVATLSAENLSVTLGGRPVLHGLSARFRPGEVTAVVGPNGAGKSTLLACLAGLRKPDAGSVSLGDAALASLSHRERARRIGFLPQTPEVAWSVDVETLVGLGRTPHSGARGLSEADRLAVAHAIKQTHLEDLALREVKSLSGGERGRALFARVLAGEPAWLLADEPLAGLDPGHQLDAVDLMRDFAAKNGQGVVMTLHDLAVAARLADRVLVLVDGRLIADGPPREALTPDVLARAYGVTARVVEGQTGPLIELVGRHG
ncbi:ABC transporter ATP-binding protein [Caulobacter hibisci]|uniref:ABC transporter ATP-binding protein n=1 Tax=Caulobacter hibisci TaxID=2035993 RepID=A0ABS0SU90_9CAUL|nr:ABC transporter ATP-binding protein [Caulobacter hibisci]MBI1682941.1 ABC transporter ATP-binding protein [Caulobacter hibisci]